MSCFKQAVLILRWFLDGTRMKQLAGDNSISKSASYDYLHALLLHRAALAAAPLAHQQAANSALTEAQRTADLSTTDRRLPDWLYWLDHNELAAVIG